MRTREKTKLNYDALVRAELARKAAGDVVAEAYVAGRNRIQEMIAERARKQAEANARTLPANQRNHEQYLHDHRPADVVNAEARAAAEGATAAALARGKELSDWQALRKQIEQASADARTARTVALAECDVAEAVIQQQRFLALEALLPELDSQIRHRFAAFHSLLKARAEEVR
jgi:hypothetical protein